MQISDESFDDFGADIAFCNELADSGEADGDEGEFRGGEKSVKDDQEKTPIRRTTNMPWEGSFVAL